MPKQQFKWVITASFTADGTVAYLKADGSFSPRLADASVYEHKEDAEAARKQAAQAESIVTDPYLLQVADTSADPAQPCDALTARERIRSQGPTVPYGRLSKSPRV
jgi:hypothetical protein